MNDRDESHSRPAPNSGPSRDDLPESVLEKLTRFVLGECSDAEQAEMERMLANSAELRRERELLEEAVHSVRVHGRTQNGARDSVASAAGATQLDPVHRSELTVAARAAAAPQPSRGWLGGPGIILAASTVLGVGSVGWWFAQDRQDSDGAGREEISRADRSDSRTTTAQIATPHGSQFEDAGASGSASGSASEQGEGAGDPTQGEVPIASPFELAVPPEFVYLPGHGAMADSTTWLGSDVDGTNSAPELPIPAGDSAYSGLRTFDALVAGFSETNWMAKVDWDSGGTGGGGGGGSGAAPAPVRMLEQLGQSVSDEFGFEGEEELGDPASGLSSAIASGEESDDYYSVASAALGSPAHGYSAVAGWTAGESQVWIGREADGLTESVIRAEERAAVPNSEADRQRREQAARALVERYLDGLARRPGERPSAMYFRYWGDHGFEETLLDAESTFGVDVDTASYSLVRNYLSRAVVPPKAAVRTEEFVNSFDYGLAPPAESAFSIHTEVAQSPFTEAGHQLLFVGLKAREVTREARPPVSLTFVIDTSGSMDQEDRLELVKESLHLLVDQLEPRDTIGIVAFESEARQVLAPHSLEHRAVIRTALDSLSPEGSTNAAAGLQLGFQMAMAQFRDESQNRLILCSDGVANTGVTDAEQMLACVERLREDDVFLECIGVGMGNHNDALLEQLADRGDGVCHYVDTRREAERIFVENLTGSLVTVAADAKVQVRFDPERVVRYRQLGYENRAVADADFRNDRVDAGEVGAGHEVVALYEVELCAGIAKDDDAGAALAEVFVRYRDPETDVVHELTHAVVRPASDGEAAPEGSVRHRLAVAVAEFAEILRRSTWARDSDLTTLVAWATPLLEELDGDEKAVEFLALVEQATGLPDLRPTPSAFEQITNAVKRNRILEARVRDLEEQKARGEHAEMLREIERQNRRLERRLHELLRGSR